MRGTRDKGFSSDGAYLRYDRVDFGDGAGHLELDYHGEPAGDRADWKVTLAFRPGGANGRKIATLKLDHGKKWNHRVSLDGVSGVHDLCVVNETREGWHFLRFKKFRVEE